MAERSAARGAVLEAAPFAWSVRVYYEDTDDGGVVYHSNYLRFFERARTEWLRSFGFDQRALRAESGVLFAVARADLVFLLPAVLDDLLEVTVGVEHMGRAGIRFVQSVRRPGEPGELQVLCQASIKVACLSATTKKPCAIPTFIIEEIPRVG